MSNPLLNNSEVDDSAAPPPYDAASSAGTWVALPHEKGPLPNAIEDRDGSDLDSSEPPPPFTATPGTLVLAPNALLIRGQVPGARPLYQLSRPLDGHAMMVTLFNVPADRWLKEDGTMGEIQGCDRLYKIYRHRDLANLDAAVAEVSSQNPGQLEGVRLKKEISVGFTGTKESFEAIWGEVRIKPLYQARKKKGILEWQNNMDELVAVDNTAGGQRLQEESLDVLVPLSKKRLDLIVALWVARVWLDTQAERLKEDKKEAKRRKSEQRNLDKEEGRPYGRIHDMKEALGIGYGVKGPSHRLYPGGMPTINQSGRINWSGSKD
jgi:hypothetical protein